MRRKFSRARTVARKTQPRAFDQTSLALWNSPTLAQFSGQRFSKGVTMLASVNDNVALGDGIQIFAAGPNCCTVCAPTSVRKSDVELEVSRGEPRGSILVWRAFAG